MGRYWDAARLLEALSRLPCERPFTSSEAFERGVLPDALRVLVEQGFLRHPIKRLYVSAELADDLRLRIHMLKLVVPDDCVVTDRTAAWLWGAPAALAPGDHLVTPPVSVFAPPGRRLRNDLVRSGERMLASGDMCELQGVLATTPLRTACDTARLLHRDQALAAMDALAAVDAFTVAELISELGRFKGYRGVIQARALAPLVDPRSGSHSESVMRLRWIDAGLPRPECQIEVPAADGGYLLLDMGLREMRFAGEYDGEEFHGAEQKTHDEERRGWIRAQGWTIIVARKHHIYGRQQNLHQILRREYKAHTSK